MIGRLRMSFKKGTNRKGEGGRRVSWIYHLKSISGESMKRDSGAGVHRRPAIEEGRGRCLPTRIVVGFV